MQLSRVLAGVSLAVGLAAFALTGALSLRAHVEPFFAVLRSVGAFAGVLCLTRWSAAALDSLEPSDDRSPSAGGFTDDAAAGPHHTPRTGNRL